VSLLKPSRATEKLRLDGDGYEKMGQRSRIVKKKKGKRVEKSGNCQGKRGVVLITRKRNYEKRLEKGQKKKKKSPLEHYKQMEYRESAGRKRSLKVQQMEGKLFIAPRQK